MWLPGNNDSSGVEKKKSGKAVLSWKKTKKVSGYIVLRKTGKGRFKQIAKLSAKKKKYTDKTVKKGKKYQYLVVSFKKVKGNKAIRISPASSVKKFSIKTRLFFDFHFKR